uniref:Uncharacterized protein n=1 Tax=Spongospora subterranea TaxID=70186 RepID=A0A0H5QVG6_9EUKA|eukprot:CRZ05591.1 hypothetical protein [Spongospora subterranea]
MNRQVAVLMIRRNQGDVDDNRDGFDRGAVNAGGEPAKSRADEEDDADDARDGILRRAASGGKGLALGRTGDDASQLLAIMRQVIEIQRNNTKEIEEIRALIVTAVNVNPSDNDVNNPRRIDRTGRTTLFDVPLRRIGFLG